MGVGRYNVTAQSDRPALDFSGPSFNYASPSAPPPGLGGVEDQRSINWAMGQKYGQQYANDNRNIMAQWQEAMNQWNNNPLTRSAAPPPRPALYQTDPNQLYGFFNSGQVGIPTTAGVLPYNPGAGPMKQDPYQIMSAAGTPTPVPAGAPAPPTPAAPPPPAASPPWNANLTPAQQEANILAVNPGGGQPGYVPPNTGLNNFGGNLTPQQRVSGAARNVPDPNTQVVTGQDPGSISPYVSPGADVQSMQPPTGAPAYRFDRYRRNMGLPAPNNWSPEAQGGNFAPPAPSVSAPAASGRGAGSGGTTYNSNRYGGQSRPSAAMAGYYSGGYGGNRRRY